MQSFVRFARAGLGAAMLSACIIAAAQTPEPQAPSYEQQLQDGQTQLAAGRADLALQDGDAAVRIDPQRWDGYALSGRALLQLKRYEAAADAFSKAIDRAPDAHQGSLRELRRESLVAESGLSLPAGPAAGAARAPAPASVPAAAPVAPVPASPLAAAAAPAAPAAPPAPAAAPEPPAPPAPVSSIARLAREASGIAPDSVWVDGSGLMWSRPWYYPRAATGPWSYADAQTFCANLDLAGHTDWRLPTSEELQRVYLVSSKRWRWSNPQFAVGYGIDDALKRGLWRPDEFNVADGRFSGNRLLIWTSTPGDHSGEHFGVYFGKPYSVADTTKVGITLGGRGRRDPFQGYALCVRRTS